MLSVFKESTGEWSMRRLLAAFYSVASVPLFIMAIPYAEKGWPVFIPGTGCIVASLLLLFFTTWTDVSTLIKSVKG